MRDEVRVARRIARIILGVVSGIPVVVGLSFVAQPGFTGGGMFEPRYITVLPWAACCVYAMGLIWIIRIYRSHLEPEATSWRYRS